MCNLQCTATVSSMSKRNPKQCREKILQARSIYTRMEKVKNTHDAREVYRNFAAEVLIRSLIKANSLSTLEGTKSTLDDASVFWCLFPSSPPLTWMTNRGTDRVGTRANCNPHRTNRTISRHFKDANWSLFHLNSHQLLFQFYLANESLSLTRV